jgi:hypothetical protein
MQTIPGALRLGLTLIECAQVARSIGANSYITRTSGYVAAAASTIVKAKSTCAP